MSQQFRTLEQVQEALATRLPQDQLKDVDGYNYVPWEVTTRQLDSIFGPFGWNEQVTNQQFDTERGIYIVSRRITGFAFIPAAGEDDYDNVVTIVREGVGVGIAQASRESGQVTPRAHDTAIKGADSDSLSRAAKKLGDAFGLYLYDRDDPARSARPASNGSASAGASTRPAAKSAPAGKGYGPSAGQRKFLNDLGWTDAVIAGMEFKQWKGILDNREHAPEAAEAPVEEGALPF